MSAKILLIGSSSGVGLTFHFTRLALNLKRLGNEVVVLSDRKEQYRELPYELKKSGIRRYSNGSIDEADITSVIKGSKAIKEMLKDDFDIIHAGGVKHGVKVFLATRRINVKPKTFATIVFLPKGLEMNLASLTYKFFYDKCVTLCDYTKTQLERLGVDPRKMSTIPLFSPDLEWFDKVKEAKVNLEDYNLQDVTGPVVLSAARHTRNKGFHFFLMAASKVLKKIDATFVIGGKGPLTTYLRNLTEKLGISKQVIFTGWIHNYHFPHVLYNIADICVSNSLIEQLPSYVLECMAAGKPVIASNVAGVPEVVKNGVTGYLFPSGVYNETARHIMELLNDPEKAKRMGMTGRNEIENKFNMKNATLRLNKVYRDVVK